MEDAACGRGGDLLMAKMSEVAGWVGADAPSADGEIVAVSSVEAADERTVVFAVDAAALKAALGSKAGVILAGKALKLDEADARVWRVADPRYAFAMIAKNLKGKGFEAGVHVSAVVGEGVEIGDGTSIGPRVVIGDGVQIGRDCNILAGVTLYPKTVLGDRVVVQAGAVLGATGFGYVRHAETSEYVVFPQQGSLYVEDDVEIGANTTIDRGALGETRIGRGTKIDNLVHIGHNCVIGKNVIIAAQTGISGSSVVEDGAILGGQVGIGEHATVGAGVILGGGAGVLSGKKMHGAGQVFWGRPARPLKEYLRDLARLRKG
ncbi:UDP-3-O-(3-hydroxymyristoyl)glucosamine N-acyltransferase [Granulicella sp. L56]|nr:UDP-3-O-(3-hydroxymyristoyl)glucosamine N-acyltransferase [Granulicella sp. L56]